MPAGTNSTLTGVIRQNLLLKEYCCWYNNTVTEKISWQDVAILCRKRKSFIELEKAFIKYGIPFLIVGGKGFFRRQTIYDIYNYVSLSDEKNDNEISRNSKYLPFFRFLMR